MPRDLRLHQRVILVDLECIHLHRERAVVDRHDGLALRHRMAHEVDEARIGKCPQQPAHPRHRDRVRRAFLDGDQRMELRDDLLEDATRVPRLARRGPGARHVDGRGALLAAIDLGDRAQQAVPRHRAALRVFAFDTDPQVDEPLDVEQAQLGKPERLGMLPEHRVDERRVGPRRRQEEQGCGHGESPATLR